MARSAVLTGRTMGDLGRNVFVTILMLIVGVLVGFRILTPAWEATCGVLLLLFFGYMLSWIFAAVGLWTGDPETAQAAAFPILAPLVFASSAFVPVSSMPSWLQGFAEHQPVSVTASAVRGLLIGQIPGVASTSWYVIQSLFWCVALIAVFAPLAVRRYRTAV
jgi:ABC-2 type transport system permease protein/oleandomycin transport system permease protein